MRLRWLLLLAIVLPWCAIQSPSIAGEITGTVFDADGKTPKVGVSVLLSSPDETLRVRLNLPRATTTDDNGRFKFSGLVSGAYTVRALGEADGTMATSQTRLPNDGARVGVWLTLRQMRSQDGAMIWGSVKTADGEVTVDAQVLYRKVGSNEWQHAQVDEFGMYFVRGLSAGEYEVVALSGRAARIPEPIKRLLIASLKPQTVTLQDGATLRLDLTALQIGRLALGGIEGLKRRAFNLRVNGQLVDEGGKPLAEVPFRVTEVQIRLRGRVGNEFAMMAAFNLPSKTDAEGKFDVVIEDVGLRKEALKVAGVAAVGGEAEFMLTFEVNGFAPAIVSLPKEVIEQILRREADEVKVDIGKVVVTRGVTLKVRVVDEGGLPIAGASVLVSFRKLAFGLAQLQMRLQLPKGQRKTRPLDKQLFARTDEDGCAVFEGMPATTLHIYASADGYELGEREVVLPLKERFVEVTVELKRKVEPQKERTRHRAAEA